ncbi:BatD family protein [Vibrio rumoiensis]|uniref:Aerotolerance protein BatD n=1 Tax=Vibrio rumoiensis 1S-45 TaxID=1188252 RepID=A0A1E5DZL3_9VIBR|nr:BatD family protein [Vibrio rumoiensis]OEF23292.1 hypothetical protein A1QC_12380 [Vibrio rumoiensis 1S-45]
MTSIFSKIRSFFIQGSKLTQGHRLFQRNKIKPFALLGLLIATFSVSQMSMAEDVAVSASVSKARISTNEIFNLQIEYMDAAHREDFDPSVLKKDFTTGQVQYGSTRSFVNGNYSVRNEWNISLSTDKTGEVVIPSFDINGSKTAPITLHVSKDPSSPTQDDLIEFQDHLSKTTLYPKEMATLTSRLLVKTDPRGLQNTKLIPPSGDGLTIDPIGQPNQYQKVINGVETTVVEQDYTVTANSAGKHILNPPRLTATVVSISRATGARRIVPVNVHSGPITLNVKEKPASYHGVWLPTQSLKLQQGWQDSEGNMVDTSTGSIDAKVGQPITRILALVVKDVSAESLPDIKIDYPKSVRVYDEKPKFGQDKSGNTVMTIKQVILPKQPGRIALPSVNVPWWNSQTSQAETAEAKGLTLNTTVDENAPVQSAAPAIKLDNKDGNSAVNTTQSAASNTATSNAPSIQAAGFWPYLTALFAFLWALTLLLLIKQKQSKVQQTQAPKVQPNAESKSLVDAIKSKDGARIQSEFTQWQAKYPNIPGEMKLAIQAEINELMASLYGVNQQDYDCGELLTLIKKAEKNHKKQPKNQDETIAKL